MPSPRYWREVPARYRLEGSRCPDCETVVYPARRVCPRCRGTPMETTRLTPRARVVTCTVIHVPPDDLISESPYAIAVVETPEGARLMTQVVDCDPDEVVPGLELSLEFRRIRREGRGGILCYGHKAVPARS